MPLRHLAENVGVAIAGTEHDTGHGNSRLLVFAPLMPLATASAIFRIEAFAIEFFAEQIGMRRVRETEHDIFDAVAAD